jgi:hypothetical protein
MDGLPVDPPAMVISKDNAIMRHNRLRALLTAEEPSLGAHLLSTWPTLVELVGQAGNYDYIEFTPNIRHSICTTWTISAARRS